jgi:hypothetical protein
MTTLWKKYHTLEKEYHPRLRLKPPTYCLYYRKEESNIAVKLLPFINKIFRFLRIVPLSFINNVTIEWD